jgi:hypothetical protein
MVSSRYVKPLGSIHMIIAQSALALGTISEETVLAYCVGLAISGVLLLVVAALPLGAPANTRLLNVALAAAMLGYAFYLFFIQTTGTVYVFWYVFVLPVVLIFRTFQAASAARKAKREAAVAAEQQPNQ